jgi:DNA-binding MarR family transcriptional regulator
MAGGNMPTIRNQNIGNGAGMAVAKRRADTSGRRRAASAGEPVQFNARIAGINYGVLDDLIGYAVRRAQLSIYVDFDQSLAAEDMSPQRFSSLVIIESNPGISQTRLAEVMGIARSGVVSIIDRFEKNGLVERQASGDRRSYNLQLTKEGQARLRKYKKTVLEHDNRIASGLTDAEKDQLRSLLRKLCQQTDR